jgi:hypothetical protein
MIRASMEHYELYKYLKQFSATFNSGTNIGTYMYANQYGEEKTVNLDSKVNLPTKFEDQKTNPHQFSNLWEQVPTGI